MRDLLWSTFLPWVRVPGTPTYRRLAAEPVPADLGDYRPYDAPHEPPGATVDDGRARTVARRLIAAEPDRVAAVTTLLDRLGLAHDADPASWTAIGTWLVERPADPATPSLTLDVGLLLGRRILDERGDDAHWEPDDGVLAHPQVVLGATIIALPLQAVEQGSDLGAVLEHALAAEEPDPEADFVAYLRTVLDDRDGAGEALTTDDVGWMLAESGLESLPELPEDVEERLAQHIGPRND
ncbi:hypothetical protein LQ327_16895 [Actinomycetospora endophytica]|uniref:Uncharacterized protein n=1 Tax=Actinomycetospora endophytica TaxID=2291215 RepID=A0ABS8P9V5_9PSEU|nr:hypothetical protein [Actinomycetospora endophytica]MCD2195045.1 hypothetical protein [Actinomycetospora endophytica]